MVNKSIHQNIYDNKLITLETNEKFEFGNVLLDSSEKVTSVFSCGVNVVLSNFIDGFVNSNCIVITDSVGISNILLING